MTIVSMSQPKLYVIGLGVSVPIHITIQASRAISRCSLLYSIVQEPVPLWLPLESVGKISVVNVLDWYREGDLRTQNYDHVSTSILEELGRNQTTGYVTYGNPMAYDRVAQNLVRGCKEAGFKVQVVPGVSSIDTVLCDLAVDMAPALQIFEASWFVAHQIQPRIDMPLLLMQVGAFGSFRTHYTKRLTGSSLAELARYLDLSYPASHPTYLVRSTAQEDEQALVTQATLANLCQATAEELSGASLYIPALTEAKPNTATIDWMSSR